MSILDKVSKCFLLGRIKEGTRWVFAKLASAWVLLFLFFFSSFPIFLCWSTVSISSYFISFLLKQLLWRWCTLWPYLNPIGQNGWWTKLEVEIVLSLIDPFLFSFWGVWQGLLDFFFGVSNVFPSSSQCVPQHVLNNNTSLHPICFA
jgi:hypothetical protein